MEQCSGRHGRGSYILGGGDTVGSKKAKKRLKTGEQFAPKSPRFGIKTPSVDNRGSSRDSLLGKTT